MADNTDPKDINPKALIRRLRAENEEEGTAASALRLAVAEIDTGVDAREGLTILNQLANGDNVEAIRKFAELFSEGRYYRKDEQRAMECLKRADELGDPVAPYLIGRRYRLGIGTAKNKDLAIRYFLRAADRGNLRAEYQLAVACFEQKHPAEGAAALEHCYKGGVREAGYDYAMCLLYGDGLRQNTEKAVAVLEKLAEDGDDDAREKLAFMYRSGFKVKPDPKKAARYAGAAGKASRTGARK